MNDERSPRERELEKRRQLERERFGRGLPDHHDPTAGVDGAPAALSALTLRLVLAVFGLLACTAGAIALAHVAAPVAYTAAIAVLAVVAAVDIVVIVRRKRRGEPG
jgi:lysozyme family protein